MPSVDRLCAAISTWMPFVEPALLVLWFELNPPPTMRDALKNVANLGGISLAIATRGWYAAPDYAGSPVAAIATAAVLVLPALCSLAIVQRVLSEGGGNRFERVVYSLGAGYGVLVAMFLPALVIFVRLGGDTL